MWGHRESDTASGLSSYSDGEERPLESRAVIIPVVLASRPLPHPQGVQRRGTQAGDTPAAWLSLSPSWDDGGGLQRSSLPEASLTSLASAQETQTQTRHSPSPHHRALCLDSLPPSGTSVAAPEGDTF